MAKTTLQKFLNALEDSGIEVRGIRFAHFGKEGIQKHRAITSWYQGSMMVTYPDRPYSGAVSRYTLTKVREIEAVREQGSLMYTGFKIILHPIL